MINRLVIEQFVIIDKLDLDLLPGLTILTGETGAGKSILLDALGLILGDPANKDAIRQGADQSIIEAHFSPATNNPVWSFLSERALASASQQEIVIRRVIRKDGSEQILLNGKPVALALLKKVGAFLGEIHGQNANQSLLDPANQLHLLDMSGAFPPEVFKNVADELHNLQRYKQEQEEENNFFSSNITRMATMQALVTRFVAAGLHEQNVEEINTEYSRLLTAHDASEAFQGITAHLVASNGAIKSLTAANMSLERHSSLDVDEMKDLSAFLTAALESARAAYSETLRLAPKYDIDTKPLHQYRERMMALQKIAEEVKVPLGELSSYYEDIAAKVDRLTNNRKRIAQLGEMISQSEVAYRHHAHILTEHRIAAAETLSNAINAELPPLKLMKAEFKVLVEEDTKNPWTERGLNTVTFTARMNPGQPFSSISETASGGELARLVLALKVVLQRIQLIPTLVFDEIDTGIGGGAAAAVGERIAHLAETTQVMTITHSPQVASRGDQHLYVSKKTDGVTTTSVLNTLSMEERIDEISRMLAGDKITTESRAAANSLINEAIAAAALRRQERKQQAAIAATAVTPATVPVSADIATTPASDTAVVE